MAKKKKDYVRCDINMETSIATRLEEFCSKSGQTKTAVIEHAVQNYINEFNKLYEKMNKAQEV